LRSRGLPLVLALDLHWPARTNTTVFPKSGRGTRSRLAPPMATILRLAPDHDATDYEPERRREGNSAARFANQRVMELNVCLAPPIAAVNERAERVRSRPIFMLPNKSSALTTANGSSLSTKFLKFCWVLLPGMVTLGERHE
jgi:hypothetical protein